MKKIKLVIAIIIVNILVNILLYTLTSNNTYAITQTTSSDIKAINTTKYPQIKEKIQALQAEHPNWKFKILYTGIEWKDAITYEYTGHGSSPKNLVPAASSYGGDWVCGYCKDKAYDSGSWRCASVSAIKYMMDPRASLNSSDIFQFLELSYNKKSGYSKDVIKKMLSGSFLENNQYIETIMKSCEKYNVNPYYIVARILQEQGKGGSVLTKGNGYNGQYVGYYNVFNIGASGNSKEKVILNGLAKAKAKGWTSLEKSLDGGISSIASSYIAVGQNTMYFQKFDVENSDGKTYWHQYMQNILAAQKEGATIKKTLNDINAINYEYTFIIPVYENMPTSVCTRPSTTSTTTQNDVELVYANVTSTIRIRNTANGSKTVGSLSKGEIAIRLEKASSKLNGTYWDKILKNDGTVGYVARCTYDNESNYKEYLVSVYGASNNNKPANQQGTSSTTNINNTNNNAANSNNSANNNVTNSNNTANNNAANTNSGNTATTNTNNTNSANTQTNQNNNSQGSEIKKGDVSGDGKITPADYVLIKNHILAVKTLNEKEKKIADINGDGKITPADYVLIKNHILYGNKL